MVSDGIYDHHLSQNAANYVPLTPISFLERTADIYPYRTSVVYGKRRATWTETHGRALALASALRRRGIGTGDTVAILSANIPEMFEAHFGVPMSGAVLNAINVRLDADTVRFILGHGEARALIVDPELAPVARQALDGLDANILVVDIEDPSFIPDAGCRDVHDVGIRRMDDDPWDRVGRCQSHVGPCLARVDRFVDTRASHRTTEDVGLAGANPDDVRVRRGDGHLANRGRRGMLKYRLPSCPLVGRLPYPPGSSCYVDRVVVTARLDDGDIGHAATNIRRADKLPRQVVERRFFDHLHVIVIQAHALFGSYYRCLLLRVGKRGYDQCRRKNDEQHASWLGNAKNDHQADDSCLGIGRIKESGVASAGKGLAIG